VRDLDYLRDLHEALTDRGLTPVPRDSVESLADYLQAAQAMPLPDPDDYIEDELLEDEKLARSVARFMRVSDPLTMEVVGGRVLLGSRQVEASMARVLAPDSTHRVRYGTLEADFDTASATVSLDPSTWEGTSLGESSVTVYLKRDESSFNPAALTVAGSAVTDATCYIPEGTVIPYIKDGGSFYLFGCDPAQELLDFQVDGANNKLKGNFRHTFGTVVTTAEWRDLHTGTDCAA